MARRKVSGKKKAVAKRGSTAVGKAHDLFKEGAKRELEREATGVGKTLSIRNSRFRFEGADLGSEINVILLDYVFVNQFFEDAWDAENRTPPGCFAIAEEGSELKPLAESPNIQNNGEECASCWANEFKTDDAGRGKACKNGRRIGVLNAEGYDDGDFLDFITSENVAYLTIPPTTNTAWRGYVNKLGKSLDLPPYGVITTLSFDPDVTYPKLEFSAAAKLEDIFDIEMIQRVLSLRDEISDELRAIPDFSNYDKSPTKKKTKKKARKKVASKKKAPARRKKRSGSKFG